VRGLSAVELTLRATWALLSRSTAASRLHVLKAPAFARLDLALAQLPRLFAFPSSGSSCPRVCALNWSLRAPPSAPLQSRTPPSSPPLSQTTATPDIATYAEPLTYTFG